MMYILLFSMASLGVSQFYLLRVSIQSGGLSVLVWEALIGVTGWPVRPACFLLLPVSQAKMEVTLWLQVRQTKAISVSVWCVYKLDVSQDLQKEFFFFLLWEYMIRI